MPLYTETNPPGFILLYRGYFPALPEQAEDVAQELLRTTDMPQIQEG